MHGTNAINIHTLGDLGKQVKLFCTIPFMSISPPCVAGAAAEPPAASNLCSSSSLDLVASSSCAERADKSRRTTIRSFFKDWTCIMHSTIFSCRRCFGRLSYAQINHSANVDIHARMIQTTITSSVFACASLSLSSFEPSSFFNWASFAFSFSNVSFFSFFASARATCPFLISFLCAPETQVQSFSWSIECIARCVCWF